MDQGSVVTERSVGPEQWGRFLSTVFDEWVHNDVGDMFIQHFDAALASWLGISPAMCIFVETCGNTLAIEHNGDLYSCDHFVEPEDLLGQLAEKTPRANQFNPVSPGLFNQFLSQRPVNPS
ncbi:MAG: hypothetical protein GY926_19040 [bacterium]|nr:hypothetical protein [bacterium]